MAQTYQGKSVRQSRAARQGDPNFQQGQDQVVITLDDGSEQTIRKSELQDQGGQQAGQQGQGQMGQTHQQSSQQAAGQPNQGQPGQQQGQGGQQQGQGQQGQKR